LLAVIACVLAAAALVVAFSVSDGKNGLPGAQGERGPAGPPGASGPPGPRGPATPIVTKIAPKPVVVLTSDVTLKQALERAAYDILGCGACYKDLSGFIADYHAQERAFQTGATSYRPPEPYTAAIAWLDKTGG